jgi:phage/plasmid-like protein (TIGR03299 family)
MAHNIDTYIGRRAAWHALGTVTGKYQTTEELLADEGFQYSVFKSQLHDGLGRLVEAYGTFRWDYKDRAKGDKAAAKFLGVVGKDYEVMQHQEGFRTIDALMRTADGAHYETAGVLGNGEKVWALADLGLTAKVGDDVQHGYLLFSTSHDRSMSHNYRLVMERVVCENTLQIAMGERTKASLTIRHTKNAMNKLVDARAALDSMGADIARMEDKLNFLASRRMTRESITSILDRLYPKVKNIDTGEEKDTTRRNNILEDILETYEMNDGNAFPQQRGTSYNLLNAITNYVDHQRSSRDDNRAESALFGTGSEIKSRALDLIIAESEKLPAVRVSESIYDFAELGLVPRS